MNASTALILIDFQAGFTDPAWGTRNNPEAEQNAQTLAAACRSYGIPVFNVRHFSTEPNSPLRPDGPGSAFLSGLEPLAGEKTYEKTVNSAFIGTDLETDLRAAGIRHVILCGLTTPHCVSTSARMAANLGFEVTLAHDACAAFAANADTGWQPGLPPMDPDAIHISAISHLHGEFVTARRTLDIVDGLG